jgi:very-short-patch-repair endonuclease
MTAALAFPALLAYLAPDLPAPVAEYRFDKVRKWRMDFAWVNERVSVEVDGSEWTRGRHTRGAGYISDCWKANTAQLAGWIYLKFTSTMLRDQPAECVAAVVMALELRKEQRR